MKVEDIKRFDRFVGKKFDGGEQGIIILENVVETPFDLDPDKDGKRISFRTIYFIPEFKFDPFERGCRKIQTLTFAEGSEFNFWDFDKNIGEAFECSFVDNYKDVVYGGKYLDQDFNPDSWSRLVRRSKLDRISCCLKPNSNIRLENIKNELKDRLSWNSDLYSVEFFGAEFGKYEINSEEKNIVRFNNEIFYYNGDELKVFEINDYSKFQRKLKKIFHFSEEHLKLYLEAYLNYLKSDG